MAKYFGLAALTQVVWSFTPSASRVVLQYLPVETYTALRWSISGLILLAACLVVCPRRFPKPAEMPPLMILGVLAYGVASLGTLYGLKLGGVVHFALMSNVSPLITSMLCIALLNERPKGKFWFSLSLFLVGIILLNRGKIAISSWQITLAASACIVGGYLCEGLAFVFSKRLSHRYPLVTYVAFLQLSAATFMWGVVFAKGAKWPAIHMPPSGWGALGFVSIFSCVLCYGLYYWLLKHIEGHRLALFDGLHSLFAASLGYLLFGETINSRMIIGGTLICASVLVNSVSEKGEPKSVESFPQITVTETVAGASQSRSAASG